MRRPICDLIQALPEATLTVEYRLCALAVERNRADGSQVVADWYDAIGGALADEIDVRAGELVIGGDIERRLGARAGGMTAEELRALGFGLLSLISAQPICPLATFHHGLLCILNEDHQRRQLVASCG